MPPTTVNVLLTGPQIGELTHILCEVFDKPELNRLVRTRLDLDLFADVASEQEPLKTVAFELVTYLNRHRRVEEILTAAAMDRPRDEALRLFVTRTLSGETAPPSEPTQAVVDALGAATEAAQDDLGLREMIGEGKTELLTTRKELDRLARYKALHDCLHTVQLQLSAIVRTAKAISSDPSAGRELLNYVRLLQRQARRARQKTDGLLTAEDELAWVGEFDGALAQAKKAVEAAVTAELGAAVEALGRLLPEAVRINGELINAARRLGPGLGSLAKTLTAVRERLETRAPDPGVVTRLRAGSTGLFELAPRLAGLADAHDGWQWVDKELAAGERLPPGPPAARVPRWARLKQRLARVCPAGSALDPAADPLELAQRWEAEADPTAAENLFQGLQAAARQEFKEVDDRLLDLADVLSSTVEPLDALLQVL
jgi:Effector-associated domain 1